MAKQRVQSGSDNTASGADRVGVQTGRTGDGKPPKQTKDSAGRTENVRSGNARVGVQADEIHGDLTVVMPRRKR